MNNQDIYKSIAARTGGDIYIGVVGPVRTGKSTFIKRFLEALVIPNIDVAARRTRAVDEMPQSSAGKTIMTTEPKFIPEEAVEIELPDGVHLRVRMIDCVGYIVPSALGYVESGQPRMIASPWFEQQVPFEVAAETGTRKVIAEHSTIGIVVTTDGSISNIPRADYLDAERRVVSELKEIHKPFVVVLNCTDPYSDEAQALAAALSGEYGVPVIPVNCLTLTEERITEILSTVTNEFPVREIAIRMPRWLGLLPRDHWLKGSVYEAVCRYAGEVERMSDVSRQLGSLTACEHIESAVKTRADLGTGSVLLTVALRPELFYRVLGEMTGLAIADESSLMPCILDLVRIKRCYQKIEGALAEVEATGYGIVMPGIDELHLEEPEIVRQGGKYGVKLCASAPSIHMLRANITTEIAPIVGSERQSEELVMSLLKDFEANPIGIWQSNIFGKSLNELVNEGLQNKLYRMPADARMKLQETLERIINDGCGGLVCIIL